VYVFLLFAMRATCPAHFSLNRRNTMY
jgi:hypothetical protein